MFCLKGKKLQKLKTRAVGHKINIQRYGGGWPMTRLYAATSGRPREGMVSLDEITRERGMRGESSIEGLVSC